MNTIQLKTGCLAFSITMADKAETLRPIWHHVREGSALEYESLHDDDNELAVLLTEQFSDRLRKFKIFEVDFDRALNAPSYSVDWAKPDITDADVSEAETLHDLQNCTIECPAELEQMIEIAIDACWRDAVAVVESAARKDIADHEAFLAEEAAALAAEPTT